MCKVEEVRRSSVHKTFIEENVYLVLNSMWDWEPVESDERRVMRSVLHFFSAR